MEVLDATRLAERLQWEGNEYWLHVEAESPFEKYPAKQHARRVQEKLGIENGLIYLAGQEGKNFEDSDMPSPFHQRRYFYYMSGCNEVDCHLTYDIHHDILALFIPRTEERHAVYYGPGMTLAEALVEFDVDEVYYADELQDFIAEWSHSRSRGNLYALHASQTPKLPKDFHSFRRTVDITSLQLAMNMARMIKDDHEIKLIRKANGISSRAHSEVLANITTFKNEAQVEGLFRDICVSEQAKKQAYDPIAASGPNAGTLHYDANNEDFEDRQLMCLDAGCEYQLYASDITRTFPLSGSWPSKEAENIYKLVERMQDACIERIAPGVRYLDLHILAHQIAIDGLLSLGILHNGTKEEIYKAGTSKAFFLHGLGHHIGLDVHDVGQAELMSVRRGKPVLQQAPSLYPENFHLPVYDPKTCHSPVDPLSSHLEEGMVVTVEPGIYFSVYALRNIYLPSPIHSKYINLEVVQRYMSVGGARIEDDILVTANGYENLTTAPKGDQMLRIIRTGQVASHNARDVVTPSRRSTYEQESPRLRAPGIRSEKVELQLKPVVRATTLPSKFSQQDSPDFEPFNGPSLFSNFRRSMTTDERAQYYQKTQRPSVRDRPFPNYPQPKTICGDINSDVRHVYMTVNIEKYANNPNCVSSHSLGLCQKCRMLSETLERLRQHLKVTEMCEAPKQAENPVQGEGKEPTPLSHAFPFRSETLNRQNNVALKHDLGTYKESKQEVSTFNKSELPFRSNPATVLSRLQHRHSLATFAPRPSATNHTSNIMLPTAFPVEERPRQPEQHTSFSSSSRHSIKGRCDRCCDRKYPCRGGFEVDLSGRHHRVGVIDDGKCLSQCPHPASDNVASPRSPVAGPSMATRGGKPHPARKVSWEPGLESRPNTTRCAQKSLPIRSSDSSFDAAAYLGESSKFAGKSEALSPVAQSLAEARNDIKEYWR